MQWNYKALHHKKGKKKKMDDPVQLKEELVQDGSTSYVPSHVATISVIEDSDDLHLGAEATSFDCANSNQATLSQLQIPITVNSENCGSKRRKFSSRGLIVMKEINSSFESTDTNRTYSSISSVVDLLQARECDADDMLTGLGFDFASECLDRRDILSRFEPSPMPTDEPNTAADGYFLENDEIPRHPTQPEYHLSISKAKEWLDLHHTEDHAAKSDSSLPSKHRVTITDQPTPVPVKRHPLLRTKSHKKFPKSRPSSFELLLPSLEEEDGNLEGGMFPRSKSCDATTEPCSSIRESSLDRTTVVAQSPEENPISATDDVKQQDKLRIDGSNFLDPFVSSSLVKNQVESFELEEINSNNGDGLDLSVVLTPESPKTEQPRSLDRRLPGNQASEHGSDDNESSSGFEEEDTSNMVPVPNIEKIVNTDEKVKTQPSTKCFQMKCSCGNTVTIPKSTTDLISQSKTLCSFSECNKLDKARLSLNEESISDGRFEAWNAFSTNYIPIRCLRPSQSSHKTLHKCIITTLPMSCDKHNELGKCRRRFLEEPRNRKELSKRCAVSGDTTRDFCASSLQLMRHRDGFALRKRRSGQFYYCGSLSGAAESQTEFFAEFLGDQCKGESLSRQQNFDGNCENSSKRTGDKRIFKSFSISALPPISETHSDVQTPNDTNTSPLPEKHKCNEAQCTTCHRTNVQDGRLLRLKFASNRNKSNSDTGKSASWYAQSR